MTLNQIEIDRKAVLVAKEVGKTITDAEKIELKALTDKQGSINPVNQAGVVVNQAGADRKSVLEAKLANKTITETEKSELHLLSYK